MVKGPETKDIITQVWLKVPAHLISGPNYQMENCSQELHLSELLFICVSSQLRGPSVVSEPEDSWAGLPASRPCTASGKARDADKTPQASGTPSPGWLSKVEAEIHSKKRGWSNTSSSPLNVSQIKAKWVQESCPRSFFKKCFFTHMKFVITRYWKYSERCTQREGGRHGHRHSDKGAWCSWNSAVTSRIWRKLGTLLADGNRSRALIRLRKLFMSFA